MHICLGANFTWNKKKKVNWNIFEKTIQPLKSVPFQSRKINGFYAIKVQKHKKKKVENQKGKIKEIRSKGL